MTAERLKILRDLWTARDDRLFPTPGPREVWEALRSAGHSTISSDAAFTLYDSIPEMLDLAQEKLKGRDG